MARIIILGLRDIKNLIVLRMFKKNTIFAMYWKNNVEAFRYYLVLESGQFHYPR